jgi:hypothetical protein
MTTQARHQLGQNLIDRQMFHAIFNDLATGIDKTTPVSEIK